MQRNVFFWNGEELDKYINGINQFKGDINILLGSKVYDGRSLMMLYNLPLLGTPLRIEFIGDEEETVKFEKFIKQFNEVRWWEEI